MEDEGKTKTDAKADTKADAYKIAKFFLGLWSNFYPPQGGSIRGFFLSVTSSNTVNTGQLRSITVN